MLYFISASALSWPLQHALIQRSAEHSDIELQRTRASSLHVASSFAFYQRVHRCWNTPIPEPSLPSNAQPAPA